MTSTIEVNERFDRIRIDSETENISFVRSEDGKCKVVFYEREKQRHAASVDGSTLVIEKADRSRLFNFSLFSFETPTITVYLPEDTYDSLDSKGSTGDIVVPGFLSFSGIDISVSTGDVDCRAPVSGRISITSSTGDIRIADITAEEVILTATTGKIDVGTTEVSGDISIKVSTGKVTLSGVSCTNLTSDGSTGSVTLFEVNASGRITLERSTGDIRIERSDAAELLLSTGTGDISGTLLSDKIFEAKSGTGHISVPDTSSGGKCRVTTSTGNITLSVQK